MFSQDIRPKWWQLYLALPLLVALFVMEHRLNISVHGHQAVQIGILILIYGLLHLWLKANASALSKMDQRQYSGRITIVQIPWEQNPDSNGAQPAALPYPHSEIKGVLSDTFEMDCIDAKFQQMKQVSQESKKE